MDDANMGTEALGQCLWTWVPQTTGKEAVGPGLVPCARGRCIRTRTAPPRSERTTHARGSAADKTNAKPTAKSQGRRQ
eukprot:231866-Rhodomonas_salina.1